MDIATLLARVDHPGYPTAADFLEDVALIPKGMDECWKDDSEGLRYRSRARGLQDGVHSELKARLSPELQEATDAIAARGGPKAPPLPLIHPEGAQMSARPPGYLPRHVMLGLPAC